MQPRLATQPDTAALSSMQHLAAHVITHGGLLNAMTIPPVPLQHSPKFSDSHPWTSLICPYHFCCCFVSQGCAKQPDIFDQDSLISPHFYPVLPGSTIFYHFFFFKVLSVYLTFQAISSRCSFKESRLVLTKFKGKNGCLKYPIHIFWLILTHFSVISDLKNSQNLHFHQFSPDLFKGEIRPFHMQSTWVVHGWKVRNPSLNFVFTTSFMV